MNKDKEGKMIKKMFKSLTVLNVSVLVLCSLTVYGCSKNATTVQPPTSTTPTPNAGVVVALVSAEAGCEISSTLVSANAAGWLTGPCVTGVESILNVVQSNGSLAKIQSAIAGMQQTAASITGLSANDQKYINAAIALAQVVLSTYEIETGQTVASAIQVSGAMLFTDAQKPKKLKFTKAEKDQMKSVKDRIKSVKSQHKQKAAASK